MSVRRFDPFRPIDAAARARHLERYLEHMEDRNGTPDLCARRLSRREAIFEEIDAKPIDWDGEVDHYGFFAHFFNRGRPDLDPRTLWLLAVAKANEGESYGVDLELKVFEKRGQNEVHPIELHLMLEEQYHSRILTEACRTCGIEFAFRTPRWGQRWMIHLIQTLPERYRWIPVLCGEVVGGNLFKVLLENCHLFSAQPDVEERLRFLLGEIWLDEVLHVAFLRARLEPWALRVAKAMTPIAAALLMRDVPELAALGCERSEMSRRLAAGIEIPDRLDWLEGDPAL